MTARVQNNGLARITSLLSTAPWYLGWGTGSAAGASANAVTAGPEARIAAATSQTTTTVTNDTLTLTGTITATGSESISEVGAFDALSSGNMDVYGDFTAIPLVSTNSVIFTINLKFQ